LFIWLIIANYQKNAQEHFGVDKFNVKIKYQKSKQQSKIIKLFLLFIEKYL